LGNNFLSHIGACDGIFHLCRKYATLLLSAYYRRPLVITLIKVNSVYNIITNIVPALVLQHDA
jgi:hypothetical protein